MNRGLVLVHLLESRARLDCLVELDAELVRDGLGDAVALAVRHAHDAGNVADGGAGQHCAEGDDLSHVVGAVFAADVVDDFFPAPILEVDVDIGHRHAVRVEEALERQLVVDRVHRGDPQGVGDDRARGRAADGDGDMLLAGERGEIGHDQEVAGVAHPADDVQLVVETGLQLGRDRAVAAGQTGLAFLLQPGLDRLALGHRKARDPQLAEGQLQVDHLRDGSRPSDGIEVVGEERGHLGRRLHVELARLEAHPPRRVEVAARSDAQQDVVRVVLLAPDIVQVVGHDDVEPDLFAQLDQLGVERQLLGHTVVHHLEVETLPAEEVPVEAGRLARQVPVVHLERLGYLTAQAGGATDQAFGVLRQDLVIDAGLVVVALEMGVCDEAAEILVASPILGKQEEVEGLAVRLALLVSHAPAGHVRLDANDRLHALCGDGLREGHRPVERAVVGDGHGVEAELGGLVGDVVYAAEPVEQAELGMDVEMDEVVRGNGHGPSL